MLRATVMWKKEDLSLPLCLSPTSNRTGKPFCPFHVHDLRPLPRPPRLPDSGQWSVWWPENSPPSHPSFKWLFNLLFFALRWSLFWSPGQLLPFTLKLVRFATPSTAALFFFLSLQAWGCCLSFLVNHWAQSDVLWSSDPSCLPAWGLSSLRAALSAGPVAPNAPPPASFSCSLLPTLWRDPFCCWITGMTIGLTSRSLPVSAQGMMVARRRVPPRDCSGPRVLESSLLLPGQECYYDFRMVNPFYFLV